MIIFLILNPYDASSVRLDHFITWKRECLCVVFLIFACIILYHCPKMVLQPYWTNRNLTDMTEDNCLAWVVKLILETILCLSGHCFLLHIDLKSSSKSKHLHISRIYSNHLNHQIWEVNRISSKWFLSNPTNSFSKLIRYTK